MIRTPIRVRRILPVLVCLALPALVSAQGDKKPRTDSSQTLPGVSVEASKPVPTAGELTAADIGRFDGVSLIGPINTIPGVFMQTRTPFGGARITLRGYYPSTSGNSPNSNGLGYQVLLNGIPITDATGTSVLDDVDYATLGHVEVIKGPNSSRYGSFIGGTVNLQTALPTANASELSQQVLSGSNNMLRTNTMFSHASDGSNFVLNYGHQGYNGFRPNDFSGKEYVRASGDFRASSKQTISTYFSYNRSNEGLAGEIDSADFYARRPVSDANYLANNSHIQITSSFAGISDRYQISDHWSAMGSAFGSGRVSDQPFAHGYTDVNQVNFGGRGSLDWSGQWDMVAVTGAVGATVQQSNNTSNGVFIIPAPPFVERPSATQNFAVNSSIFTEWTFTFPRGWVATVGGSLNNNAFATRNMLKANQLFDTTTLAKQTFGAQFTPRVALTKTWDNYTAYANMSTGYAPPLLSQIIANNGTVDLTLKPEHATQYEVGVMGNWFNRRLTGQLTWYNLDNTDKLVSQTANAVTFTTNAGEQRNQGYEVSLGWLAIDDKDMWLSMLHPWVTYTYTDAKYVSFKSDANATAATVDFSGNAVARVPKTMYSVGIDANVTGGWYVNSTYQFVDQVPISFDNSQWMKSYTLLNAKIGYRTMISDHYGLDISAGGSNLTGSTYYNAIFTGANMKGLAQAQDGGTGDGYILPAPYDAQYFVNFKLSYKW